MYPLRTVGGCKQKEQPTYSQAALKLPSEFGPHGSEFWVWKTELFQIQKIVYDLQLF